MATSRDGMKAEWYFLQACQRLGFRRVEKTHPFVPLTIRKTETHGYEDVFEFKDYVLTLPRDKRGRAMPTIPIQLTLVKARYYLREKRRAASRGEIVLIYPSHKFGPMFNEGGNRHNRQERFLQVLRRASRGEKLMLWVLGQMLKTNIEIFLDTEIVVERGLVMPKEFPILVDCVESMTKKDLNLIIPWLTKQERGAITSMFHNSQIGNKQARFIKIKKYLLRLAY